jgi:hypothetical protein
VFAPGSTWTTGLGEAHKWSVGSIHIDPEPTRFRLNVGRDLVSQLDSFDLRSDIDHDTRVFVANGYGRSVEVGIILYVKIAAAHSRGPHFHEYVAGTDLGLRYVNELYIAWSPT